jgi:hypothetical protein
MEINVGKLLQTVAHQMMIMFQQSSLQRAIDHVGNSKPRGRSMKLKPLN